MSGISLPPHPKWGAACEAYEYLRDDGMRCAQAKYRNGADSPKHGAWWIEGTDGAYYLSNGDVKLERLRPYNASLLNNPHSRHETIILCEGPKDADALVGLGFVASDHRALVAVHAGWFRDRDVVIIQDRDPPSSATNGGGYRNHVSGKKTPGERAAAKARRILAPVARRLAVVEMPGDGVKDAAQWVSLQTGTPAEKAAVLRALFDHALACGDGAKSTPTISTFEDLTMQPRTFLWRPYLPDGGYCLLGGRGESGKTTLAVALHAWASTGQFPEYQCQPVRSLIIEKQDDDGDEIKPKLIANGYDPRMVLRLVKKKMPTFEELEALITEHGLGMITMSPLNAFVGQYTKSLNDDLEVEPILDRLHGLGVRHTCLCNGIKHLNKKPDLASDQRISGAGGFVNSARTVVMLAYDRANDVRLVEIIKASRGFVGSWRMTLTDLGEDAAPDNPTAFVKATLTPAEPGDSMDTMLAPKNGLSEQAQDVVDFFAERQGDYSYKEVAKSLGRGDATTKTQLNRMANRGHISRGGCDGTFKRRGRPNAA